MSEASNGDRIPQRKAGEPRAVSPTQQRLWYLYQLAPGSPVYNTPFLSRLRGNLDIAAFERAIESVVQRHEILRTVFLAYQGNPLPVPLKRWSAELKHTDLRHLPDAQRESEAHRLVRLEAARPFNLARDVLFRPSLFRIADDEYLFVHVSPHIIFEGSSIGPLNRDLSTFYNALISDRSPDLPALPIQYYDFALWQRRALSAERVEVLSQYWKKQLAGATPIELPLDFPRPATLSLQGTRHRFAMPKPLISNIKAFHKRFGVTAYRGLLATFNVFLHCYSGANDICVGSPFGPRRDEIRDLVGFFVNTVVLRNDVSRDLTFLQLAGQVSACVNEAIAHSDLPFDKVVEAVRPPRDPSRTPIFQVNFRAPREPYPPLLLEGIESGSPEYLDNGTAKFDLALEIETSLGEACYFEYSADLFREQTIVQMELDFQRVLQVLLEAPDIPLGQLPALQEIMRRSSDIRLWSEPA